MVAIEGKFRSWGGFLKGGNRDGTEEKGIKIANARPGENVCLKSAFRDRRLASEVSPGRQRFVQMYTKSRKINALIEPKKL
jgi:hypothetical protein